MKIAHGMLDGQVLQRDRRNRGAARVRGTCEVDGPVSWRLTGGGKVGAWTRCGTARGGRFEARIKGIPAGGPYVVELRIAGGREGEARAAVADVYVGDVWFMAGQSNMQGIGNMEDAPPPHRSVRCFFMSDEWRMAKDPLHLLCEARDPVHHTLSGLSERPSEEAITRERRQAVKGVGVGVYFGRLMQARTGVPQGLVACAHGGTSMAQWDPALKSRGGASLYGAMLRRFRKLGQPAAGILWYQGESDASAAAAAVYTERMTKLVRATRRDFGQPRLPWIVVQIGRVVSGAWDSRAWNAIQEQERRLPERIAGLDVVPVIDLDLDDGIHVSGKDYARLAARMARCASRRVPAGQKAKPPVALAGVRCTHRKASTGRTYPVVEVAFENVEGRLCSAGRPLGFTLADSRGTLMDFVHKTTLEGSKAVLEVSTDPSMLESLFLHYGLGCNPAANVTDSEDMGVPVFGPIPVSEKAGTDFVHGWQVARLSAKSEKVAALPYPADLMRSGRWGDATRLSGVASFMALPAPVETDRGGTYVFRLAVTAARACRATVAAGADSPFKVWMNRKPVLADAAATNPCVPDRYQARAFLRKGRNEVVVAFDTRLGRGWGICMRFKPVPPSKRLAEGLISAGAWAPAR